MSQSAHARRTALAVMQAALLVALTLPAASGVAAFSQDDATVWINEIHYDNTGTDSEEFIEVAGPADTVLDGWSLVLYNGAGGASYTTSPLSGTIPAQQSGFGTVSVLYPPNGIQNGSPDGIALVNGTTVVQFLSYEGSFTATGGPATGIASTDIGVSEVGTEPLEQSLQLAGSGNVYQDFTWTGPAARSMGTPNAGQTFTPSTATPWINEIHYDNTGTDTGEAIEVAGPAGTNLAGWSIVLYNGSGGAPYDTDALTGIIPDQQAGFGTSFISYPSNGIQNGAPDGIALVNGTTVVQFLSYEGSFTAVGGPANGMTSTDIGVLQGGSDPIGRSLQLIGAGKQYAQFTWAAPNTSTFGAVNNGQSFEDDVTPVVDASVPPDGRAGVSPTADLTVTFSEEVTVTDPWFSLVCAETGAHPATVTGGPVEFTLDPTTDLGPAEACTLTIEADAVRDVDTKDPPDTMAADVVIDFTTLDACGTDATRIHAIQGTASASPIVGQVVEVEAVVVGDYQAATSFNGFHIQEEDADADTNDVTSEGLFISEEALQVDVAAGDVVRVGGTVTELDSNGPLLTELALVGGIVVCSHGASVTPADVRLPFASAGFAERYEGMLADFGDQELSVTETFGLGRFGEAVLSSGGRLRNPTSIVEPGAPANTQQAANDRNRIVLDDGDNQQNLDPTRYPQGGLSAANTLRVGDTVTGGTYVLEHRFSVYRLQPVDPVTFAHENTRPATPTDVGGNLKVAAMNVLNYFTSLDDPSLPTGSPERNICGPTGGQECRGADSAAEFDRQRRKIIAAIVGLDADIVGLMEIENNATASLQDLVAGLNAATAPGTWAFIDTGTIGTDAIKVAFIYRPGNVTPVGAHAILTSAVDSRFIATRNRPSLAQTFELGADGGRLTVVVNHLKSKGSACTGDAAQPLPDPDKLDGQGNCPETRRLAAEALVDWIANDPTGSGDRDVLVIGDLNAYAKEDPIDVFVRPDSGYTNLIEESLGDEGYSFVFQGQSGYLDHALASPTLAAQVTGATEWHVNADEPVVLDYNLEFKSPNHQTSLFAPDQNRSSDHDPLLVGIELLDFDFGGFVGPVDPQPTVNAVKAGQAVPVRFSLVGDHGLTVFFVTPAVQLHECDAAPEDPIETTVPAGASSLQYDAATDTYTYVWKTEKAWSGKCGTLSLEFDDGTHFQADFRFTK